MVETVWILDINESGASEDAYAYAKRDYNIVFTGRISREDAIKKIKHLLKLSDNEIRFYQADLSKKENFELFQSYVINSFGEYCLAKPIAKKDKGSK